METITPVTHDLGDFKVRRTLPAKSRTMVGPFIFVDQFGPAKLPAGHGMDVRPHPHIKPLEPFALYLIAPRHKASLKAATPARAMLLGGEAFVTKRHVWWNFVSSSRDRINQAKKDWQARRFPLVPDDDEEFIPIPAVPKTVSYL